MTDNTTVLHFQCKPAPIRRLYEHIFPLSILGVLFVTIGLFVQHGMKKGWVECRFNSSPIECTEIWWAPWLFIAIGIGLAVIGIIASKTAYARNTQMVFNFYADCIECRRKGQLISKCNILPSDRIFISPQTSTQKQYHVATILIEPSLPIEISSLSHISSQPYFVLPNISHYQQIYQQICNLYHIEPEKT